MSIEPGLDCGHECCDERNNPFHDHFLDPTDCVHCAARRARKAELEAEIEGLKGRINRLTNGAEEGPTE